MKVVVIICFVNGVMSFFIDAAPFCFPNKIYPSRVGEKVLEGERKYAHCFFFEQPWLRIFSQMEQKTNRCEEVKAALGDSN